MYRDGDITQEPIACALRNTAEEVENRVLYFIFEKPIFLENNFLIAKFQIEGTSATITLPYTTSANKALWFNETRLNGSLDITTLSPFKITEAFSKLIIENVLQDSWLLVTIVTVTMLIVLFLGILVSRSQTPIV